jgi:polyhydroxybutyrate depolymerase
MQRALVSIIVGSSLSLAGCSESDSDRGGWDQPANDSGDAGGTDDDGTDESTASTSGEGTQTDVTETEAGETETEDDGGDPLPDCEPGSLDGAAGATDDEQTPGGLLYNVRTPDDYDPTVAHPLILVASPAGADRNGNEQFTRLTSAATGAGYLIAYVGNIQPNDPAGIEELTKIPGLVQDRWCVDPGRVFVTGHSNGGTLSHMLAGWGNSMLEPAPAAIAPSAAGIGPSALSGLTCRAPLPALVMHSSNDTLFPGFGKPAADWWANCNGCDSTFDEPFSNGCLPYANCPDGANVVFCEGSGQHGVWPDLNAFMITFFDAF